MKSVQDAFNEYDPKKLNHTWVQLQYVMVEILKQKGGNKYKTPHAGKNRLERLGILPTDITIPEDVVQESVSFLNEGLVGGAMVGDEGMDLVGH